MLCTMSSCLLQAAHQVLTKCEIEGILTKGNKCDFCLMMSKVASWRHHNCRRRMIWPISMKMLEGYLGLNCIEKKKLMMSLVMLFGSNIDFLNMKTFKNLLLNSWTDWGKTLQVWSPIHKEQKVIQLWHHRSHGLAAMIFRKTFKNLLIQMAWQIEGTPHPHVPQALWIPGCSWIINRSLGPRAILDWT